jgi:N-acetylmuramoyl-L-alanine amidase
MVYNRLPNDLPERLRKYGLTVVETDGWKTRGRPVSTGEFYPQGVLCHHTATGKNWTDKSVVDLLINGRKDLPGPLSQFGLTRDGTVYIIASGRCNHAGPSKASGTVSAGDGNKLYVGIEAFNDGIKEAWNSTQYKAYYTLCAALSLEITKNSSQTVRGHKETSTSGKPDPKFDMNVFRARVSEVMKESAIDVATPPYIPIKVGVKQTFPLNKWVKADLGKVDKIQPPIGANDWDFYLNLDLESLTGAARNDLRYVLGRWARHDDDSADKIEMGGELVDVTGADTKAISLDLPKATWRSTWTHGFKGEKNVPVSFWIYIGSLKDGTIVSPLRIYKVDDES